MIWIWITLACLMTCFQLMNKKISWHHYIWMLLPIDMYGIVVSNVTIKPFMLFSFLILLKVIASFKRNSDARFNVRFVITLLVLFSCFFCVDIFNGSGFASFKQQFMLFIVVICALFYVSLLKWDKDLLQIRQVIIAVALGYGIVFLVAIQMNLQGINPGGLSTFVRTSEGMMLIFPDIAQGRLRGFFIDPNVLITGFIVAIAIALLSLSNESGLKTKAQYLLTIVVCTFDLYFTESRTALIIMILTLLFSALIYLRQSRLVSESIMILLITSIFIVLFFNIDWDLVYSNKLLAQYMSRSSFNDEYGRMTIWKNAWNILLENNVLLGIGQGQISNYTYRDCHNTWLEWIVGNGIYFGGLVVSMFVSVPLIFYKKCRRIIKLKNDYYSICLGLIIGFIGILISLCTVSNITNSSLVFMAVLLILIPIPIVKEDKIY